MKTSRRATESIDVSAADSTRREFMQGSLAVAGTMLATQVAVPSAAAEPKTKRPNLIFFLGEGQRADALSLAGHPLLKTPNMDRVGSEGIRFRNAFCTNALCAETPSLMTATCTTLFFGSCRAARAEAALMCFCNE